MILDSRIKDGKRPLTCIDIEQARAFVGKKCLFSDSYNNFVDIEKYSKNKQYIATLSIEENPTNEEFVFINNRDGYRYRLALPLECFRLMGFSDEEFNRIKGVSNTQLYKMAGNSIVVNVLEGIFNNLLRG